MNMFDNKKRVIFDVDYTLLVPNYTNEKEFIERCIPGSGIADRMGEIFVSYEKNYERYERNTLLNFLNMYSNVLLDDKFLDCYFEFSSLIPSQDNREVVDVLEYLKRKDYELVVLSNWFTFIQKKKLKRLGVLDYFSDIYGGDIFLKPSYQSFKNACSDKYPCECVMIGDNLEADILGAMDCGMDAIHITNGKDEKHSYLKIKRLSELKNIL